MAVQLSVQKIISSHLERSTQVRNIGFPGKLTKLFKCMILSGWQKYCSGRGEGVQGREMWSKMVVSVLTDDLLIDVLFYKISC